MSEKRTRWLTYIASAMLPLVIILLAYTINKGLPFTHKNTLLIIDMNQQYVDFYSFFRQTILHGQWSNLFFSFSNGLGSDTWGIWAYYLMSPLNLILLFFNEHFLTSGIFILMLVKYMLASLSMTMLLRHLNYRNRWIVILSTTYALCGWAAAYQLDLMWLDALFILPMLILGIELMFETASLSLYTGMFALALIDNYYMGYMVILFGGLYFFYRLVITKYPTDKLQWLVVKDYIIASTVGIVMSLWFWLPTLLQLQSSKATYKTPIQFDWLESPTKSILKTFNSAYNFKELRVGGANMYIGLALIVCVIWYFFNKNFRLTERIAGLIVLALLYISTLNHAPALMWQAFQNPIWYPFRFSYLISFWMIFLAGKQLKYQSTISLKKWALTSVGLILYGVLGIYLIHLKGVAYVRPADVLFSVFIALVVITLMVSRRYVTVEAWKMLLIILVMSLDMGMNYVNSTNVIAPWTESQYQTAMKQLNDMKDYDLDVASQYRSVFLETRSRNDMIHLNVHGISEFSSTTDALTSQFMKYIGVSQSTVGYTYANGTLITDALFGVHSLMDVKKTDILFPALNRYDLGSYKREVNAKGVIRYTNDNALPVAFPTSDKIYDNWIGLPGVFNHQIQWLNAVAPGKDVLMRYQKIRPQRYFKHGYQYLKYKYKGLKNAVNYIEFPANFNNGIVSFKGLYSFKNNGRKQSIPLNTSANLVVNVANKDTNKIVVRTKSKVQLKYQNFKLYSISPSILRERLQPVLNDSKSVKMNYVNSGQVNIDVDMKKNQVLATSLAYNDNYVIYDNGQLVDGKMYNGSMLAINVKNPGHHHIVIKYQVNGLTPAFLISSIAFGLFIVWAIIDRRRYM